MITIRASGAVIQVDPHRGWLTSIALGKQQVKLASVQPAGFLEVLDHHDRRTWDSLSRPFAIREVQQSARGRKEILSFVQQHRGAPFSIHQTFEETTRGIRWDARLRLQPGQRRSRSVSVSWVLAMPAGWWFWTPQDTTPRQSDGMTPLRGVYGHISFRPFPGTMIPLVAVWGQQAGMVAFSPPEIQKPYISFDVRTQHGFNAITGIGRNFADAQHLCITHHLVGLRPGKELHLAICLAGIQPDWRCALGHYAKAYPELFEPIPPTRKVEGMYGITTPTRLAKGHLKDLRTAGVTFAEVHGHFPEYSVFIKPEVLSDPQRTWHCRPHRSKPLSLADNRQWIEKLLDAGIAPFMYFYNYCALPSTIRRLWPTEPMRDEDGRIIVKYRQEPALHGQPDSPYGRHVLEQMDLLLKAYPRTAGFFVDNYSIEMIDFAHDDGVTMVHDRPAYDLNRNHQVLGPLCFEKAHRRGKIIMVNKVSTIESLRGADMVLAETRGLMHLRAHALACVCRPLFPLAMQLPEGPNPVERGLQHLLLQGCIPDKDLYRKDAATLKAYRPLTDAMIGKRWVLEFDPLTLPPGVDGQIFRIDASAPCGGDAVVALADLRRSWREKRPPGQIKVSIRLRENGRYGRASWLAVERSSKPAVACALERKGKTIVCRVPSMGAAGILRLRH